MNDEPILLASAYLDGDVTADERALVETDPDLLAEVEQLRSVRFMLGDVEPASISVREQHLAAALQSWDNVIATATVIAPTPLGDRRSRTSSRLLLGAAAAIMVVLAGGIALQTVTGDSNDESSSAKTDTTEPAAAALAETADATDRAADESGTGATAESATQPAEVAAEDPTAGDVPATAAPDGTAFDTGIDDAAPPGELELERLSTPDELGIFASDAVGVPIPPDVPAATSAPIDDLTATQPAIAAEWPLCLGADVVVGPALYRDVEVVVGIDERRDLALAYLAANCREVARAPLP